MATVSPAPRRILSGIQPSGKLHLGNYFGMMRPAIELQDRGEALYFIADYHSMTSLFDAAERRRNTLDVALDFLACGRRRQGRPDLRGDRRCRAAHRGQSRRYARQERDHSQPTGVEPREPDLPVRRAPGASHGGLGHVVKDILA